MSSPSSAGSASPMAPDDSAPPPQGQSSHENGGNDGPEAGGGESGAGEDDLDSSFFPAPAHYYKLYTDANLALGPDEDVPLSEPRCKRKDLEPPSADWVLERGSYSVFGETWPVVETLPNLEDQGIKELFVRGGDRTVALQTLLKAMLVSYSTLVSALLAPPPSLPALNGAQPSTDPERLVEHIRLISINMHHLVNELRPVQARETLKTMMRTQIDTRRAKTAAMKLKCAELTATLAALKSDLSTASLSPKATLVAEKSTAGKGSRGLDAERLRAAVDAMDD